MRISDWSSVVCSSDLGDGAAHRRAPRCAGAALLAAVRRRLDRPAGYDGLESRHVGAGCCPGDAVDAAVALRGKRRLSGQTLCSACADEGGGGAQRKPAPPVGGAAAVGCRSEEHTSELQSLMRISYAVFCLKKKNNRNITHT